MTSSNGLFMQWLCFGLNELKDSDAKSISNLFKYALQKLDGKWTGHSNEL